MASRDNYTRLRDKLNENDKKYNRDNGESIIKTPDRLRFSAYIQDLEQFKAAYLLFIKHNEKKNIFIDQIKFQLEAKNPCIVFHMGVKEPKKDPLPFIGQFRLRFGLPTCKEYVDHIIEGIQTAYDIRSIIGTVRELEWHYKEMTKKDDRLRREQHREHMLGILKNVLKDFEESEYDELEKN